jgi:hypothetical protein
MSTLSKARSMSNNFPRITKIVALACGTFLRDNPRQTYQHALIRILRAIFAELQQRPWSEISCFAQDPQYDHVDEEALSRLGITVAKDPDGFLQMDDSTIFFAVRPSEPIMSVIADMARPAVMICRRVEPRDEFWQICPRVKAMIRKDYTEFDFPRDDDNFAKELVVYVKNANGTATKDLPGAVHSDQ